MEDKFEPDYKNECDVCGATPVVTVTRAGKVMNTTGMCGPCTWGEAAMVDPDEWEK
jgi:hypothetical protein